MTATRRLCLVLLLFVSVYPAYAGPEKRAPARVLFVGNSLTYVGNLPSVLAALAASNGRPIATEMFVKGGATLADSAREGSVRKALESTHYDFVVLQERGGDIFCVDADRPSGETCKSEQAHRDLARMALAHGAKPLLLGTYQQLESASQAIETKEDALAQRIGAIHIPVSERFRRLRAESGAKHWFHEDGMHPGHDLVLLEAIWLYRAIFNSIPRPHDLVVTQPMFGPNARFDGSIPASAQSPAVAVKAYRYDQREVADLIRIGTRVDTQVP